MSVGDQLALLLPSLVQLAFVLAVGCCIGSMLNVLVYRMPKGLGVVTPASRCPACDTRLTWRENIPVIGWLMLRGRCRFCRSKISAEYPLVELFTGVLFAGMYAAWYLGAQRHGGFSMIGDAFAPDWATNGIVLTWPMFVVVLTAIACMIAMTLVDARTYTIPLMLTWVPAIAAAVILPAHAAWFAWAHGEPDVWVESAQLWRTSSGFSWHAADGWVWSLPTPPLRGWWWIGGSIGAVIGLGVSVVLVRLGLIGRSFADYDAWEAEATAKAEAEGADAVAGGPEAWIQYPHARREMVKELAFLGPAAMLLVGGGWLGERIGAWTTDPVALYPRSPVLVAGEAPLWLVVLGGVCLGYLIGGGVVWAVRIFGSMAFGKEAIGIGDVHLMAAAGACFGWIDATLGFFASAFLALAWALAGLLTGGRVKRAMPFGPFLAGGTVLVLLLKPWVEMGLGLLMSSPTPIDLP